MNASAPWPLVNLGDHIDLLTGFPFNSSRYTTDPNGVPLLRGYNVVQGKLRWENMVRWPANELAQYEKYELEPNDVVLAMDRPWVEAGLKYAWIAEQDCPILLVQRVARLRGGETLSTKFLRYVVADRSFSAYLAAIVTGVNVPHISGQQIKSYRFRLPPLPIQHKIAGILSAYDGLIENNNRRIAILEEMARLIYREWFVRFRFPGHEQVRMLESELGLVPDGWESTTLGDHVTLDRGLSYKGRFLSDDGTPMINLKNILPEGGLRRSGTKFYTGEYKPRHAVTSGDLVLANTDLTQAGNIIGSPAFVPRIPGKTAMVLSHHLYAVRMDDQARLSRHFLFHLMASDAFRAFARGHASGTTVLGLRRESVLRFPFTLPPRVLLDMFYKVAEAIYSSKECYAQLSGSLRHARDLLLPRLVSGEVDVSEVDVETGGVDS